MLVNLNRLESILRDIRNEQAKLVMETSARKPFDEVSYDAGRFTVYDPTAAPDNRH